MERFVSIAVATLVLVHLTTGFVVNYKVNDRPVIGIVAEKTYSGKHGDEFIQTSYVNYLEMAGARVVPVLGKRPDAYYQQLFTQLNGILFPGGGVNLTVGPYHETGEIFLNLAKKAYDDNGDYFPIWGTCLGFELLTVLVADFNLLNNTDSENLILPLDFTDDFQESRLFKDAPPELITWMKSESVTQNNHKYSLTTETFNEAKILRDFFRVMSTNVDRKGRRFVSTMEAYKYPFYATQWHPEKNLFDWDPRDAVDHSAHAQRVTQYMANFFVNEARRSSHSFPSEEELSRAVIENYESVYVPNAFHSSESFYFNYSSHHDLSHRGRGNTPKGSLLGGPLLYLPNY